MKNLVVSKEFDNKKLSIYLHHMFDGLSINTIYKALRRKDIIINGRRISTNISIHENDEITIYINDELLYKNIDLEIIYEDENIAVLHKPIGIEVINEKHYQKGFVAFVKEYYHSENDFPAPCHRLDRNTSGLILFAKHQESLNILLDKFKQQEIEKHYLCAVYGISKKKSDTLTAYLFKDQKKKLVYISDEPKKGYQKIVTSYTVLEKDAVGDKLLSLQDSDNISIFDVTLHTGRTHQIRAHLAHIGYPIIGDRQIWTG